MQLQARFREIIRDPNALTLFRIAAAPLVVILLLWPNRLTCFLAALIFSAAAITDYFDGLLARQSRQATRFGAFLDSVLDRWSDSAFFIGLLIWYSRAGMQMQEIRIPLAYLTPTTPCGI